MFETEESRSASFQKFTGANKKRKWQAFVHEGPKKKKRKGIKIQDTQHSVENKAQKKQLETQAAVTMSNNDGSMSNIIHDPTLKVMKKNKKLKKHMQNHGGSNNTNAHQLPKLKYGDIQAQRKELPIFTAKKKLLSELHRLPSAVLIGETGSGKTTQIPQYILEAGLNRGMMIAVTQPRRVAAITVAQRVAQEMGSQVGQKVGYCVRFDNTTSEETKIKYMTDGMLLREAILDPLLKRYSIVILDEAHERTIDTDVLFGVVKKAQRRRQKKKLPWLKVLVMSATMDVDHFSKYFRNAPVLYVEGRQYPVQLMYSNESQSDYLFASVVTVFQIHKETPANEDILVFLTGQEEIESMVKSVRDIAEDLPSTMPALVVYPLYASLPPAQQLRVFQPAPKGHRKIIISTNIAETSVTIHGIKHVIDCGMVKLKSFQPTSGLELLKVGRVSQAQAWQRTGRAGRECPGTCYRLYTEPEFEGLAINTVPEIQRCSLASVVLQLMALGIPDVFNFDFMDKPSTETLQNAFDRLVLLDAVIKDTNENRKYELTEKGRQMAAFPLEPCLAKVILAANELNCLEEILTVVSMLSAESVLFTPHNKREQANAVRRKFISSDGDHLTMLSVYRAYKAANGNKQWCHENFINQKNMKMVVEVRGQLRDICEHHGMEMKSCGRDLTSVRKCLCAGFFMNAAELQKEGTYVTVQSRKQVTIHPSSALFMCKPKIVIYNEMTETNKCYIRDVSAVDGEWLFDVAPSYFKRKHFSR